MIKGVNRQMIEVTQLSNPYFERALLVVKPMGYDLPGERLHEEARHFLREVGGYSALRRVRRRRLWTRLLFALGSVAVGAMIGAAIGAVWR